MLEFLLLVIAANAAPVLAARLCGPRGAWPVDGGRCLRDGRALLGASKTWRGLVCGLVAGAAGAALLGLPVVLGFTTAALSLAGDLLASFTKRRLGFVAGDYAPLLDTLPEILLPAIVLRDSLALGWLDILFAAMLFHFGVRLGSPLLYRLHLRRHPW